MNAQLRALLAAVAIFVTCIGNAGPHATQHTSSAAAIPTLTPQQVDRRRATQDVHVLDANPRDIFEKHHVPGAVHVDYDRITASQLPNDRAAVVIFYCMNELCGASPIAARRAVELGWSNVYLMPEGIQGWLKAGLPIETGRASD